MSIPFVPFITCNLYFAYQSDDECLDIKYLGVFTLRMWLMGGGYMILGVFLILSITFLSNGRCNY